MINEKDKQMLQKLWNDAKVPTNSPVPDGIYEFTIKDSIFKISAKGIPQIICEYEITGGNDTFIGEHIRSVDNLQTADNMGWFKKKLARLGIAIPENAAELETKIPMELKGKIFSGQLKTKEEFVNVYVNKLIGETTVQAETENALKVGAQASFISAKGAEITGTILSFDSTYAKIKTNEGKIFKVALEKVSVIEENTVPNDFVTEEETVEEVNEEAEMLNEEANVVDEEVEEAESANEGIETEEVQENEEEEEKEEEEEEEEEVSIPTPEEATALKLLEIKKILAAIGIDAAKIKAPKIFIIGLSNVIYTKKYMPDITTLVALRDGLNLKVIKNEKPVDTYKRIQATVKKML